jgi:hypothetical protein
VDARTWERWERRVRWLGGAAATRGPGLCEQQGARDGISKLQNDPYATSAVDSTYQRHLRRLCSLQLPRVFDSSTPGGLSILIPDSWFLIPECPMSIIALSLSGLPPCPSSDPWHITAQLPTVLRRAFSFPPLSKVLCSSTRNVGPWLIRQISLRSHGIGFARGSQ